MKGAYNIRVYRDNKELEYKLSISRQITIVCGDSGTGKDYAV